MGTAKKRCNVYCSAKGNNQCKKVGLEQLVLVQLQMKQADNDGFMRGAVRIPDISWIISTTRHLIRTASPPSSVKIHFSYSSNAFIILSPYQLFLLFLSFGSARLHSAHTPFNPNSSLCMFVFLFAHFHIFFVKEEARELSVGKTDKEEEVRKTRKPGQ